jgi:Glycosyl hydrolase family 76
VPFGTIQGPLQLDGRLDLLGRTRKHQAPALSHGLGALLTTALVVAASVGLALAGGAAASAGAAPRAAASRAPTTPPLSSNQLKYLKLAVNGVKATSRWWDPKYNWYIEYLGDGKKYPQASIWDIVPLFEAENEIAIAQPTANNRSAVAAFATHAEDYWNPDLQPTPGYAPYPGDLAANQITWFDDNGWLGLAFMDADTATGSTSFLGDAERAFNFINAHGWDASAGGGMWWNTYHPVRSGEALAADTDLAARLYLATGNRSYLGSAEKWVSWAQAHLHSHRTGLFSQRIRNSVQVPNDGEGALVAAFATLCKATGNRSWCGRAESLATADVRWLAPFNEGPQYETILVRGLLTLYSYDHRAKWYKFAVSQANRVLKHARTAPATYLRNWNGAASFPNAVPNMLRTDAASVSLFADLATVAPPK